MHAQLGGGQHFEEFIIGPQAPRQHDKAGGAVDHLLLAHEQVGHDLGGLAMGQGGSMSRRKSGRMPSTVVPAFPRRAGDIAHQARAAAAEHQGMAQCQRSRPRSRGPRHERPGRRRTRNRRKRRLRVFSMTVNGVARMRASS